MKRVKTSSGHGRHHYLKPKFKNPRKMASGFLKLYTDEELKELIAKRKAAGL